ncbi:MAG: tRNA (N6-isopentenyl adenosine(37)-C2)-methylthiotransferase MiaB [Armatimonadota bacterium]
MWYIHIIMRSKTYHILTYGCQMNEFDSQVIEHQMQSSGFIPEENVKAADIIIFNTCCVRENADQKVYGRLGEFKELKRNNPDLIIAVCGCLAQKDKNELLKRFDNVNLVLGTNNLSRLGSEIVKISEENNPIQRLIEDLEGDPEEVDAKRNNNFSAYIPISIGCDCFCTFCIVPYVRGRLRSKPVDVIVKEAEKLAGLGYKEIFLLGQNVNAYGVDRGESEFTELLKRVNDIDGIERIRFTSPHPKDFTVEQVKEISKLDKVCRQIHLPLQSGDDLILKRMKRGYTSSQFYELASAIREYFGPECSITTDIIVGFPNEEEAHFENTLKMAEKVEFDNAFMFAYSKRSGTPAARIEDNVSHEEKMRRLYKLIEVQNNITQKKNLGLIGKELSVMVEGEAKKNKDNNMLEGRSSCGRRVVFEGAKSLIGEIIPVKIKEAFIWGVKGEIV